MIKKFDTFETNCIRMKNLITIISLFLVAFVQAQPLSPLTVNISMSDSKTLAADV